MQRAIVDLPQPDSPTTPSVSPRLSVKETSSTALTAATCFWNTIPRVTGKCFVRCSTLRSSSAIPYNASVANAARILSASRAFVASSRKHACTCSGCTGDGTSSGSSCLQRSKTYGQRGLKRQPRRRRQERRRRARNLDEPVDVGLEPRQRAEQAPRVRVQRMLEELVDRSLLGHPGRVHHDDLVGDLGDDAEVVGDHDDRGAVVVLELVHQLEDLRLRRDVERRRRLVGDQQSTAR